MFLLISALAIVVDLVDPGLEFNPVWIAILLCGAPIVWEAINALVRDMNIKADLLVSIALLSSIMIDQLFAAATIAFIMTLGSMLEEMTVSKARRGIEGLSEMRPTEARVIVGGVETMVPIDRVSIGDRIRIFAGETVVADGTVVFGHASIDQSLMTGESLPRDVDVGDKVISGTMNCYGAFDMTVESVGTDSSIQKMIDLVESSDPNKAKIVREADRWATWIVVIALLSAIGTYIMTGDIVRSVTVLVVFCPCAFVLATPTAIMASIGNATRKGVLISKGDALERLSYVRGVVFDKTGTITTGELTVSDVISYDRRFDEYELMELVASSEMMSEHPLGKALVSHYELNAGRVVTEPESFNMIPGRGVMAMVRGIRVSVGNEKMVLEDGIHIPEAVESYVFMARSRGSVVVYVSLDGDVAGVVILEDRIRPESTDTVKDLYDLGLSVTMLTGDNELSAENVSKSTGILDVIGGCMPDDKLRYVCDIEDSGCHLCMVGDGVNDAAALKSSCSSIAMGMGSDIAMDCADMVLVKDDVSVIPYLIRLSRRTMGVIRVNLIMALGVNAVAMGLAVFGLIGPVLGALVHNVGSLIVIGYSATLLKWNYEGSNGNAIIEIKSSVSEHCPYER